MAQNIIYIDETAFLALNDKDDSNHDKAVVFVKSFLGQTVKYTTSFLSVTDTINELIQRKGYKSARKFLEFINTCGIEVLHENSSIRDEAKDRFKFAEQKNADMRACYHVATMHHFGIHKIFTFSSHFDKLEVIKANK